MTRKRNREKNDKKRSDREREREIREARGLERLKRLLKLHVEWV